MCLTPRTFVDNLDCNESSAPYDIDYDSCDYVDVGESISISTGDLAIMQLNIRGLYSKTDKLKALLNECTSGKKIDVILLCETGKVNQAPYQKWMAIPTSINTANINLVVVSGCLSLID